MAQIGNKINAGLNGEWGAHVRPFLKRVTASRRRLQGMAVVREERSVSPFADYETLDTLQRKEIKENIFEEVVVESIGEEQYLTMTSNEGHRLYPLQELCIMKKAA